VTTGEEGDAASATKRRKKSKKSRHLPLDVPTECVLATDDRTSRIEEKANMQPDSVPVFVAETQHVSMENGGKPGDKESVSKSEAVEER